jgi:two-component system chemotaxis response regulator CheY
MLTSNSIIMIIDTAENRSVLKKDLQQLGYSLTLEASDLDDAMLKIQESTVGGKPVSLIMCDWSATKVGGNSLIGKFRASPLLITTPIIMLVSNLELSQALVSASVHINGYLVKPYSMEVLKNSLPMALANKVV